MRKKLTRRTIFLICILVIVGIASFVFARKGGLTGGETYGTSLRNVLNIKVPTQNSPLGQRPNRPEAFPYEDMTIPYLRNRQYESKLGDLEKVSENANFTSYLTSYDSDGLKINGLMTIPNEGPSTDAQDDSRKYPAVIFVHGYIPPSEYKTLVNYVSYADYLAKNGLVVFKIDLRGHDKSEGEASGAYYSGDYIVDTLNAYSALQNADFVNPAKVYLWGHSMAGNIVFRSFVAKQTIPKAVIWAGAGYTYSDLSEYRIQDNSYRPAPTTTERFRKRRQLFDTYGNFDPESDFWKQVPATNYLDGVEGSLQIHHAVNDPVVSIEYSRNLMKILDTTTIPHQLFEYPSGGHNLTGTSFTEAMEATVEFFKE